jgi:hypothetical protein
MAKDQTSRQRQLFSSAAVLGMVVFVVTYLLLGWLPDRTPGWQRVLAVLGAATLVGLLLGLLYRVLAWRRRMAPPDQG